MVSQQSNTKVKKPSRNHNERKFREVEKSKLKKVIKNI